MRNRCCEFCDHPSLMSGERFRPWLLPKWLTGKEFACQHRSVGFDPWVRKIPWRKTWQPTPVFLPGKCHGQRSQVGYSPWGRQESDVTEYACTPRKNPGKVLQKTRYGKWNMEFWPPLRAPFSLNLQVLINPEALQILSLWDFMEASVHRHSWLNHWPSVIELNLQLFSPPRKLG